MLTENVGYESTGNQTEEYGALPKSMNFALSRATLNQHPA